MSKISRIYNAAVGATMDRVLITKGAKGKIDKDDLQMYEILKKTTGASTHNPVQVLKNWNKAYKSNYLRQLRIEAINNQFKTKSNLIKDIFIRQKH